MQARAYEDTWKSFEDIYQSLNKHRKIKKNADKRNDIIDKLLNIVVMRAPSGACKVDFVNKKISCPDITACADLESLATLKGESATYCTGLLEEGMQKHNSLAKFEDYLRREQSVIESNEDFVLKYERHDRIYWPRQSTHEQVF